MSKEKVFYYLLVVLSAFASPLRVHAQDFVWSFDNTLASFCTGSCADVTAPPTAQVMPSSAKASYHLAGRLMAAAKIGSESSNSGYKLNLDTKYSNNSYGFAWMGYFYLKSYPTAAQNISSLAWQEGSDAGKYKAGFAITVNSEGQLAAAFGQNGAWKTALKAPTRFGLNAWHHVALVFDRTNARAHLLLDGVSQAVVPFSGLPDESASVPVTIGSYYAGGTPKYLLNGWVDQFYFSKLSAAYDPANSPVMRQYGLSFRNQVINDLIACSSYTGITESNKHILNSPTIESTSILRAWVNAFFQEGRLGLPLDPLTSKSIENYNFPTDGSIKPVKPSSCPLLAAKKTSLTNAPNSLYLRVRDAYQTGNCGTTSSILWGVYRAFGFMVRMEDWMGRPEFIYSGDSHVLNEVYIPELAEYLMQDATFNITGLDSARKPYNIADLYLLRKQKPTTIPFTNQGFQFNPNPIKLWQSPTADYYFGNFGYPGNIFPAWTW